MKKRFLSMVLCAAMVFVFTACGNSTPTSSGTNNNGNAGSASEPLVLSFATQHPIDHVAHASAENIKIAIEEGTEGRVLIDLYPASQLGDYLQVYEEIMRGTIQIAHISGNEQFDSRGTANFLPYIASDYSELEKAYGPDSYLGEQFVEIQGALGIKFLGFYCEGLSGIGSKTEVTDPITFGTDKNTLLRIAPFTTWSETIGGFGYRTSNIPYADAYSAIQTGVVDGWAGGPANLNYMTFRDVINYYYQINVTTEATQYLMTADVFNSLSPADQKVVEDAFKAESMNSFKDAQAEDEKYMQMLRDVGVEVVTFTPEELEKAARDVREVVWPKLETVYSQKLVQGLAAALN